MRNIYHVFRTLGTLDAAETCLSWWAGLNTILYNTHEPLVLLLL